jgi:hypothetical protein
MINAEVPPEMKPSRQALKSTAPRPRPGDWVAHRLSKPDLPLATGRDMSAVLASLREQQLDTTGVGVYQVPWEPTEAEFLGGGEIEFPTKD